MPNIEPAETIAAQVAGIGEPLEFKTERERVDAVEWLEPTELPLDVALEMTLRHDAGVQAALARVRQAQADSRQARLLPNPILNLAVRFPEGGGGSPDIEAGVAADLLALLFRPGRVSAADQRLRQSTAESLTIVLDVIAEVQEQYTKAQALAARVAVDESRRAILIDLVKVTEARLRGGEAARLDVLTVQSEQAALETELLGVRSAERQARLALARLIGQPSSTATWQLDRWSPPSPMPNDESYWLSLAQQQRPELQAITWQLAALGDDLRVAHFAAFDGAAVGIEAERDGDWSVGPGASMPIPLFDFGQVNRERLRATIIEQRHDLTRNERLIVQEVRTALEQFRTSAAALTTVQTRSLPLQEQRLGQAQNSYRLGLADVLAVRIAEQDFQHARSQEIELQAQVSIARSRLIRAVGGLKSASPASRQSTTNITEQS